MTPNEYQRLAAKTECNQEESLATIMEWGDEIERFHSVRMLHAVIGACGELGELAQLIERWLYYGRGLDHNKIEDEMGDVLWYLAQMGNAAGVSLEAAMEANIRKLRQRHPEGFNGDYTDAKG